jgi:hypothetical protein
MVLYRQKTIDRGTHLLTVWCEYRGINIMGFRGVAVCTMTALVAGDLAAQANEAAQPEDVPLLSLQQQSNLAVTVTQIENEAIAIASPEVLPAQSFHEFSQPVTTTPAQVGLEPASVADASNQASTRVENVVAVEEQRLTATMATGYASSFKPGVSRAEALQQPEMSRTETVAPEASATATMLANKSLATTKAAPSQVAAQPTGKSCPLASQAPAANAQLLAQNLEPSGTVRCPRPEPIAPLTPPPEYETESSPALSIYIPVGYGADNNTLFLSGTYQEDVRFSDEDDGALGFGIGLGDSRDAVGVELSYAIASFGGSRDFGTGGFNAKVHRQFPGDFAVAIGGNGILNLFDRNDFEQSYYGTVTKVFRTRESIDDLFSRVALTVGVGNGQFRSSGAVDDGVDNINAFGNIAIRIARPVSFITEWTGRDLALGLSIAPFKNFPLTITPALRDVAGAGDGARFVLGAGIAFRF